MKEPSVLIYKYDRINVRGDGGTSVKTDYSPTFATGIFKTNKSRNNEITVKRSMRLSY